MLLSLQQEVLIVANINIRVDDTLKQQAETVLDQVGLSMTAATTVFLKQVVRCNGLPFQVVADPFWSAENQEHLLAAAKRMDTTGGTAHELVDQ
jgi:DNA-damage-inducible protein J